MWFLLWMFCIFQFKKTVQFKQIKIQTSSQGHRYTIRLKLMNLNTKRTKITENHTIWRRKKLLPNLYNKNWIEKYKYLHCLFLFQMIFFCIYSFIFIFDSTKGKIVWFSASSQCLSGQDIFHIKKSVSNVWL